MSGADATAEPPLRHHFRWKHLLVSALAIVVVGALAHLLGWNITRWFTRVWNDFGSISIGWVAAAIALATASTALAAFAYLSILRFAFPNAGVRFPTVFAIYAASVALNLILPASLGTLAMVWMFTAVFPGVTFAGALAVVAVQKIFFVAIGVITYLNLFLSIGGTFNVKFGFMKSHPWTTVVLAVALVFLVAVLIHLLWPRVLGWWEQAKEGGQILVHPRAYTAGVLLPNALSWLASVGVIAVLLTGYSIPLGLTTLVRVVASGSLAGAASVTPGGAGVNQAFAVVALSHVTSATTATAYSVSQQVLTTTWALLLAVLLMTLVFGWSGGKELVETSFAEAEHTHEERKEEKASKTRLMPKP